MAGGQKAGLSGALLAILTFLAVAGVPATVHAHDFGGNSQPNPPDPPPDNPPCKKPCPCACDGPGNPPFSGPNVGHPINTLTGAERITATDIEMQSIFPIAIRRHYDSRAQFDTALGYGWSFEFDRRLFEYPDGSIVLRLANGVRATFTLAGGSFVAPRDGVQGTLTEQPDGTYQFRYGTGDLDVYDADGRLIAEQSKEGDQHEFLYDSRGKLPLVGTSPFSVDPTQPAVVAYMPRLTRMQERSADGQLTGYAIDFTYDENTGRLTKLTTDDGREVHYTHDVVGTNLTMGNLTQVDGLGDLFFLYKYEDAHDAHNVTWDQRGQNSTPIQNTYDTSDRVAQQVEGATILTFTYTTPEQSTTVTRQIFDDQGNALPSAVSVYQWNASGYPTSEKNANNNTLLTFYTANMDVDYTELRNASNVVQKQVHYGFDGMAHPTSESVTLDAADGGATITKSSTYDQNWLSSEQLVSTADPAKIFRTEYTFVRAGGLGSTPVAIQSVQRRNDDGTFSTTTYTYCTMIDVGLPNSTCPYLRLLKSVDGPRTDVSDVTSYVYYPATDVSGCSTKPLGACHRKGQLWKITNALSQVTEYVRYDKAGRAAEVKDPNGVVTDFEYDVRGRMLTKKVRGTNDSVETDDAITSYVYDDVGDITHETRPDGASITYTFDTRHRLTQISDGYGNRIHYALDSEGNRLRDDTYDPSNTPTRTKSRTFDKLNELTQKKDAQGNPTNYTYLANGQTDLSTDPLGHQVNHDYDDLDRPTTTTLDSGSGGIAAALKHQYDAAGHVVQYTDSKNLTTQYVYDARGNVMTLTSPDTGTTGYTYDAADNRTSETDARNVQTTYTYDALNRLLTMQYPTASLNVTYHYDEPDATTGCTGSFPVGRLTRMLDSTGTTTYCYDRRGNKTQKTQLVGSTTLTVKYTYDLADHVTRIDYPGGRSAVYTRDSDGRITGVNYGALVYNPVATGITYVPFGPPTNYTFPGSQTLTKTYDQNYRISDLAGNGINYHIERNASGLISALDSAGGRTVIERYTYDGLYRLQTVHDGSNNNVESYTYEKTGDRLTKTVGTNPAQTYAYSPTSHQLQSVAGQTRTYDNDGNTKTDAADSRTYGYDDRERMTGITSTLGSASYKYNGRGQRVSKTASPTTTIFLYDEAGSLLGEYTSTGTPIRSYVYVDTTPVGVVDSSSTRYIWTDHLGTPRALTSAAGAVVWTWSLTGNPFGEAAPNEDADGDGVATTLPLRYPGQYYDSESKLHYNYHRDYQPGIGRYIQSDPVGLMAGPNTYGYALGNPFQIFDRHGLMGGNNPFQCLSDPSCYQWGWYYAQGERDEGYHAIAQCEFAKKIFHCAAWAGAEVFLDINIDKDDFPEIMIALLKHHAKEEAFEVAKDFAEDWLNRALAHMVPFVGEIWFAGEVIATVIVTWQCSY